MVALPNDLALPPHLHRHPQQRMRGQAGFDISVVTRVIHPGGDVRNIALVAASGRGDFAQLDDSGFHDCNISASACPLIRQLYEGPKVKWAQVAADAKLRGMPGRQFIRHGQRALGLRSSPWQICGFHDASEPPAVNWPWLQLG